MIRPFLIAMQFLTRIPVRFNEAPEKGEIGKSVLYYPLIGLLMGLLLWLLAALYISVHVPTAITASLILLTWVLVTGGLHLDGLADSIDAFYGGRGERERTLAIMKDPQCGAMAVIAIGLVLILKNAGIETLIERNAINLLVIPPVVGRLVIPLLFLTTTYVRTQGIGKVMSQYIPVHQTILTIATGCAAVIAIYGIVGLFAILAGGAVYLFLRHKMYVSIGGMTGDTAGMTVEIVETILLVIIGCQR